MGKDHFFGKAYYRPEYCRTSLHEYKKLGENDYYDRVDIYDFYGQKYYKDVTCLVRFHTFDDEGAVRCEYPPSYHWKYDREVYRCKKCRRPGAVEQKTLLRAYVHYCHLCGHREVDTWEKY